MNNRRPYIVEGVAVKPGCAVAQGSADNLATLICQDGATDFIGIYPFEANETKSEGEPIGIVLYGVAKALVSGEVLAGRKAILDTNNPGALANHPGRSSDVITIGTFLESGQEGDYVDVLIGCGSIGNY